MGLLDGLKRIQTIDDVLKNVKKKEIVFGFNQDKKIANLRQKNKNNLRNINVLERDIEGSSFDHKDMLKTIGKIRKLLENEPTINNYNIKKNLNLIIEDLINNAINFCSRDSDLGVMLCLRNIRDFLEDGQMGGECYSNYDYVEATLYYHYYSRDYQIAMAKANSLRKENELLIEEYNRDDTPQSRLNSLEEQVEMNNKIIENRLGEAHNAKAQAARALDVLSTLVLNNQNTLKIGTNNLLTILESAHDIAYEDHHLREKLDIVGEKVNELIRRPVESDKTVNNNIVDDTSEPKKKKKLVSK